MRFLRRIVICALVVFLLWLAGCGAIGVIALEGVLHPAHRALTAADESLARAVADRDQAALADVTIRAGDGTALRAWTFTPLTRNGDAVIVLHGQGDSRLGMLSNADLLLRHGYVVLLPDARAHGESGGSIATYGVLEANDIEQWFEWLHRTYLPHCVSGLGNSMGAAELLNSLAVEPNFCAVVADSPFSDFRSAAYDRMGQKFQTGAWLGQTILRPAVEIGFLYAKWKYGIDFSKASPIDSVAASHTPVMLIHGLADDNLPPYHSERIKAEDSAVELWELPGTGHCGASKDAPAEYERRVIGWFANHDNSLAER